MHPFAYRLLAGSSRIALAPPNDDGFEIEDEEDEGLELDDDLDEDDQGEDDDLDEDDQGDAEDEPPPRSRGETRTAKLAREAKELREENERLKREDQARRAAPDNQQQQAQPRETQEQFNARIAQMDPLERVSYLTDLAARNTNAQLAQMQFTLADQTDKIGFDSFCASNAEARKLASEVDTRLADYRKGGVNIPRMDVLKHILGERALSNLGRSRNKAERQAEARREQQRGRPSASRGDVAREGRDTGGSKSARDKRVENMKI